MNFCTYTEKESHSLITLTHRLGGFICYLIETTIIFKDHLKMGEISSNSSKFTAANEHGDHYEI